MRTVKMGVLLCFFAGVVFASRSAMAGTVIVTLGPSTSGNGIIFSSNGTTGQLDIDVGGCSFTSTTCTSGNPLTGAISVSGIKGTYSLSADNSLYAYFAGTSLSGVDTWDIGGLSGTDSDSYTLNDPGLGLTVTGAVDWTQILENGGVTLLGTATYTISGKLSGSGSTGISVALAPLTCNSEVTGACTLANVSDEKGDPPAAFSSVGSGTFGTTPPSSTTPEPGTLLLFGSGLSALGFIRRRFARV